MGGGFPGNNVTQTQEKSISFHQIAAALGSTVDELFPPHVRVIAEPGRYFVSSAFTLAVSIVARRVVPRDPKTVSPDSSVGNSNTTLSEVAKMDDVTPTRNDHPSFMCK